MIDFNASVTATFEFQFKIFNRLHIESAVAYTLQMYIKAV